MNNIVAYLKSQIHFFHNHRFDFFDIMLYFPSDEENDYEFIAKNLTEYLKREYPYWDAEIFWDNEKLLLINRDGEEALKKFFYEEFLDSSEYLKGLE